MFSTCTHTLHCTVYMIVCVRWLAFHLPPSLLPSPSLPLSSLPPLQEEKESKRKVSRSSRSPSVCKTPELTSESSSEEASDTDR